MSRITQRLCVLAVGVAITAGCAQAPRRTAPSATTAPAAAAAAPSTAASAGGATAADVTPQLLEMARNDGYRPVSRDGETLYCRNQIPIGSNLPTRHCVDSTRLRFEVLEEQQERLNLNQQKAMIGQPSAGGG